MTDRDQLQKLFQAALTAPVTEQAHLTRAFPHPAHAPQPAPAATPVHSEPAPVATPAVVSAPAPDLVTPMPNAGLDEKTSTELGILLDEQIRRKTRRRRLEWLATAAVFLITTGGGFAWFVQSPARTQAFHEAMIDIRSAGDLKGMVGKYKKALDKIAKRSQEIDGATGSMGVSADQSAEKDPYFNAEMKGMMGGEGKTVGERNAGLHHSFDEAQSGRPKTVSTGIFPRH